MPSHLAVLLLFAAPLAAQVPVTQVQEQITVERILVDTRVTDDRGNPITGLKASAFRVRVDEEQRVERDTRLARGRRRGPETTIGTLAGTHGDVAVVVRHPAARGQEVRVLDELGSQLRVAHTLT